MIYRATRRTRSEGFRWDEGTPRAYQRCSDVLMGFSVSEEPYYVICGHTPLCVWISEGEEVDSRENRVYEAHEVETDPDEAGGRALIAALQQEMLLFPSEDAFEAALVYAAEHLPRARTAHTVISRNVAQSEGNGMILLSYKPQTPLSPAPEWTAYLPYFEDAAEGIARPDRNGRLPSFDTFYEAVLSGSSNNHSQRMLTFIAYTCGADFDPTAADTWTHYMQTAEPDDALIRRFISDIPREAFRPEEMLPLLYELEGRDADRMLADCVRRVANPELLRNLQENAPAPQSGTFTDCFARACDLGFGGFPLDRAEIADLWGLYRYFTERNVTADELEDYLADDDVSRSMKELFAAQQYGDGTVSGIMPAVLFWYEAISKEECDTLYGSPQEGARMRAQVKLMTAPKRMLMTEFFGELYGTKVRRKVNVPGIAAAALLAGLLLGGIGGALLGRRHTAESGGEPASSVSTSVTATGMTSLSATVTSTEAVTEVPQQVRTAALRVTAEEQEKITAFLATQGGLPEGIQVSEGIVCGRASAELLRDHSAGFPQLRQIPYRSDTGAGMLILAVEGESYVLEQNVPAPAPDSMPEMWFDLQQIELDLAARTAEPAQLALLLCDAESPYGQLVYSISGGAEYVTPYRFKPAQAGVLVSLGEGSPYRITDYLTWAESAAAETTAPAVP